VYVLASEGKTKHRLAVSLDRNGHHTLMQHTAYDEAPAPPPPLPSLLLVTTTALVLHTLEDNQDRLGAAYIAPVDRSQRPPHPHAAYGL
jgi:hypothetical protein